MNSRSYRPVITVALFLLFAPLGCSSYFARFSPPIKHETQIILKENDFKIVQTNLVGKASVSYLFSFIPLGDERLYSRALGDLYSQATGEVTGTPAQLIHWTVDETTTVLPIPIVSWKTVVFRADLMQFTK